MVHIPLIFLSEWREFPSAPRLAGGKKILMTASVTMLLKSRALPDMLPFSLCNKKRLAIRHMNRHLFPNDTIVSVLRHREVGRSKDLSAPPLKIAIKHFCATLNIFTYLTATHTHWMHCCFSMAKVCTPTLCIVMYVQNLMFVGSCIILIAE